MTPEELRTALEAQPVPDHRPGFWDDLGNELGSRAPAPGRRAGWLVAVGAAAAVIAVAGVAALLIRQAPLDTGPVATEGPQTATTLVSPATEPVAVSTSQAVSEDGIAPWDRGLLSIEDVPSALTTEWRRAENQLWCSAIYPTDIGVGDADLRRAEFSGGWALAWDLPELRSAFGVAGVGSPAWEGIGIRMPNTISYGEQVVGYGGEGFDDAAEQRMAEFSIPGQLCGYQVWSKLGDEHLVELVDSLRLVDGLEAAPIDLDARPGDWGPADRGPAP
ncbi:MAG: hypothetical protein OEQ47_14270, partial [Acidimicrobiia bacterium]|nr:hypothetical protein [Acidimicrobiia bacterium]